MSERIKMVVQAVRSTLSGMAAAVGSLFRCGAKGGINAGASVASGRNLRRLVGLGLLGGAAYLVTLHPPMRKVAPGYMGLRINQLTGGTTAVTEGAVFLVPGTNYARCRCWTRSTAPRQTRRRSSRLKGWPWASTSRCAMHWIRRAWCAMHRPCRRISMAPSSSRTCRA